MSDINDHTRKTLPIKAVHVASNNDGDEYYEVGGFDVSAIEWGETCGHMAALKTLVVYKNGQLHSEHLFSNVLGVYYATPSEELKA